MKQKYYALFNEGLSSYEPSKVFVDNLVIHTVYAHGRSIASWKAVKEVAEHYSMLDLSPIAVFEEREIDMITFIYYNVTGFEACDWLRYIIENASRDRGAFRALTHDRTHRKDEHLLNVVLFLVNHAEKDNEESEFE